MPHTTFDDSIGENVFANMVWFLGLNNRRSYICGAYAEQIWNKNLGHM